MDAVDLVVTPSHVYLATDCVGCRLVAASDRSNKKSTPQKAQFVFKARQKLLDLTSIVSLLFWEISHVGVDSERCITVL